MGMWRSDEEEKRWSVVDPSNPHNRWNSSVKPSAFSSPSEQGLGGIFESVPTSNTSSSGFDGANSGPCGANSDDGGFETLSNIIWFLATSSLTIYLMYLVVAPKFTWDFPSIFATVVTSIIAFLVIGAIVAIPVAILDFLLIKPIKWIVGRFSE